MEQRPMQGMWGRYVLFVVLALGILTANYYLMSLYSPRRQGPEAVAQKGPPAAKKAEPAAKKAEPAAGGAAATAKAGPGVKKEEGKKEEGAAAAKAAPAAKPASPKAPEPEVPETAVTLGSLDPSSPYRMLVTLTGRGAAVRRIELNSPRYHELDDRRGLYDRSGYLGYVVVTSGARGKGCPVQVVGHGTPAEKAGLVAGDLITAVDDQPVTGSATLADALKKTKPGQAITLKVTRKGGEVSLPVTLGWRPLEIIGHEDQSPPSFLIGLTQIDNESLVKPDAAADGANAAGGEQKAADGAQNAAAPAKALDVDREIEGAGLRNVNWELVAHDDTHVKFRRVLPRWELELTKTFRLAKVAPEDEKRTDAADYHLTFDFEIRNTAKRERKVAYYLDGPNSLPVEGWWYASKVSHTMGAAGLRDVVVSFQGNIVVISAVEIGGGKNEAKRRDQPMEYIGVDAQYFSVIMIPQGPDANDIWFSEWLPLGYGKPEAEMPPSVTNTSFRVTSTVRELKPAGGVQGSFMVFAGPKKPDLLAQYGLGEILYYGWFGPVATALLAILHTFFAVIPNYGVAIILLTVLVRCCMFPLSRKQALNAQKMQELQPEIKKIQEKYKNNMEARGKAQQELFRKHKYNPMGGCLIVFLQLPIFVGLYRALMVDVELRQAPLISESIRWASNLAAPDMLFNWSSFMPAFINRGVGMFGLGPYFNLLPILTIVLFIWQQKKFMPPPTDDQQAMQHKIMQFMMIFMGILFFKVASGLCIYFIASSLWSIAERQYLPKMKPKDPGDPAAVARPTPRVIPGRDGGSGGKRKARGKRG